MKKGFDLVDPEIASRQHQLQPSTNSTPTNLSPRHRNIGQSYDSDDLESSNSSSSSSNSIMSSEKASLLPLQVDSEAPKVTYSHFCVAVGSCLLYSLCSISMVILNKYISSGLSPEAREKLPDLLVIFLQCLVAVVSVEAAKLFGIVQYPSFEWKVAKAWLPLNLLFIGMLFSGFMSLVYVSVPMVTIFKNLTNLVTVTGDWYLFGEKVTPLTILSVAVMTIGAIMSGANDLQFTIIGYSWQALNCILTSSYTLYMRYASVNINLPKFGMVFYNNLLSCMILLPVCFLRGEFTMIQDPEILTMPFLVSTVLAGFIGFFLNFASLWCVSSTSATTYAIVGSLNKVPITLLGFILFQAQITNEGIIFVTMATLGGFMYAYAKLQK